MNALPRFALSVRQPWAWAIIHAGKDIENRSWQSNHPSLPERGPLCIHAAQGMTQEEYANAARFMASIDVTCPPPADLWRGGIIGTVEFWTVTRKHPSPWFFGPLGLVMEKPAPCAFVPAKGELGIFAWKPCDAGEVPAPARWMLPKPQPAQQQLI